MYYLLTTVRQRAQYVNMKRLIIEVQDKQHAALKRKCARLGITIANYFRQQEGWPLEQQGARKDLQSKKLQPDAK